MCTASWIVELSSPKCCLVQSAARVECPDPAATGCLLWHEPSVVTRCLLLRCWSVRLTMVYCSLYDVAILYCRPSPPDVSSGMRRPTIATSVDAGSAAAIGRINTGLSFPYGPTGASVARLSEAKQWSWLRLLQRTKSSLNWVWNVGPVRLTGRVAECGAWLATGAFQYPFCRRRRPIRAWWGRFCVVYGLRLGFRRHFTCISSVYVYLHSIHSQPVNNWTTEYNRLAPRTVFSEQIGFCF